MWCTATLGGTDNPLHCKSPSLGWWSNHGLDPWLAAQGGVTMGPTHGVLHGLQPWHHHAWWSNYHTINKKKKKNLYHLKTCLKIKNTFWIIENQQKNLNQTKMSFKEEHGFRPWTWRQPSRATRTHEINLYIDSNMITTCIITKETNFIWLSIKKTQNKFMHVVGIHNSSHVTTLKTIGSV
jgi:hypothetical protein